MLKSEQNSSITKNINSANCLEINYYDPYGNKVGAYYSAPANAAIFISNKRLKEIIDSNIPENHQIVPYFAYPQHDITSDNTTEEIMIAVKKSILLINKKLINDSKIESIDEFFY